MNVIMQNISYCAYMNKIIENLKKYILEVLDLQINPKPIALTNLPIFFKNSYFIYDVLIYRKSYLLAMARNSEEASPAQIAKHMAQLERIIEKPCIFIADNLPAYNRHRLVLHKVRFVVPCVQMYLPDLGIDYRKTALKNLEVPNAFNPSEQAVIIFALITGPSKTCTPSQLANELHYTRITMTRALNTLEALGLGKTVRKGKERFFYFQEKQDILWKQSLPFMQTPVKATYWIQANEKTINAIKGLGYIAGLSALAKKSTVISPNYEIYAIYFKRWESLPESFKILPIAEGAQMQIEVWNYDPELFAKDKIVDDFSLYLSLKNQTDERIEKALENLSEKRKW